MVQRAGALFAAYNRPQPTGTVVDPLPKLLQESEAVLYTLESVFPLTLFPDKIIIRANHVDVISGIFFGSAVSTRVQISDVRQVDVQFNPLFATLEIIPQGPLEQTMRVSFLWKDHAKKARRILGGLVESHLKKVDFSKYGSEELTSAMEELGKARE